MQTAASFPKITIGVDLGERKSRICEIDAGAQILKETSVATTRGAVEAYFAGRERCRVVLEAGTHSPWFSRQVRALSHEDVVANPSELHGNRRRKKRNDRSDARFLARQGRADIELLHPIQHHGANAQEHLELIRARDQLARPAGPPRWPSTDKALSSKARRTRRNVLRALRAVRVSA